MKILVTGANGFIGKNLIAELRNQGYEEIQLFTRANQLSELKGMTADCDFVFHLAGVNRPKEESEFEEGNAVLVEALVKALEHNQNTCPVLMTSSSQAELDNPYGESKRRGEQILFGHRQRSGASVYIYRLPNVFGKWCKPFYNSVVATFCHQIARGEALQISDPDKMMTLVYIDDVIKEFLRALKGAPEINGQYCMVTTLHQISLGRLADKLIAYGKNRETLIMPALYTDLDKALYGTFLHYLPQDKFSYPLKKNEDNRGWLAEFIKSEEMGQVFVSRTKPGITRGNHWHHTKVEKFLVIQGQGVVRFRDIFTEEVIEYRVDGEQPEVVDIPVGYTHSIVNVGDGDMITLFWASEMLHPERPDTYYVEV